MAGDEAGREEEVEDVDLDAPRLARIATAKIDALTLNAMADPEAALTAALVPGTRIQRHSRTWLMGQVRRDAEGALVGRIGFQSEGTLTEVWDDDKLDFTEERVLTGTTSPFAVNPETMRVAFQLRPGVIRVHSFTGALQALMNAASPIDRWRVFPEVEEIPFAQWAKTVDRVARLRIRLREPNPHYGDRMRVRDLVDGANAHMVDVVWKADRDALDGLDINDSFIQEAITHAERYGNYSAVGERDGRTLVWASSAEAAAEERIVIADPATHEVSGEDLVAEIAGGEDGESDGDGELEASGGVA